MYSASQILSAREERRNVIQSVAQQGNSLYTIKANIPGQNKNLPESYFLTRIFSSLCKELGCNGRRLFDGADGAWVVAVTQNPNAKQFAVHLEETHPLGRFVDIDVYLNGQAQSVSRGTLRKCFVCDKPAFVCGRSGAHTTQQLLSALISSTRSWISQELSAIIKQSLMEELNLENKFGLVTPSSSGSHADMDYALMQKAQDAIIPYLVEMFWIGADCTQIETLLASLRPVGIAAEKAMYKATQGVNAYKGMIFVFGVLLASVAKAVASGEGESGVFNNVKRACANLTEELFHADTFGGKAYKLYRIKGVRGHAEDGFNVIKQASQMLANGEGLLQTLTYIVGNIDDTVLLKRAGDIQSYTYYKNLIKNLNVKDQNELQRANELCLKHNLSVGGSADVLAASVMFVKLSRLYCLDLEKTL